MKYAGTAGESQADAQMHRLAERLLAEYTTQIDHGPAPSEMRRQHATPTGYLPTAGRVA